MSKHARILFSHTHSLVCLSPATRKVILADHKTPLDLKVPGLDLAASTLELELHQMDFAAATEVVASTAEKGGVTSITLVSTTVPNGTLSVFHRKKAKVRSVAFYLLRNGRLSILT
eukprot:3934084-Rhodomonas_salina.3